jgi:hypothetical protein
MVRRDQDSFNKHSKLIADSIAKYNRILIRYYAYARHGNEHYIPTLYKLLRKSMSPELARQRLHKDTVDAGIIGERNFLIYIPEEAKAMDHSHKGKRKKIHTLSDGQTLEVPDTMSEGQESDEPDEEAGEVEEDQEWADDEEEEEEDSDVIPTTEREFLQSMKGANSFDSSFGVGIRTVNFAIPNLSEDQNKLAQSLLHTAIHDQLVLYVKSEGFSREVTRQLHEQLKLALGKTPLITEYTDMALTMGVSAMTFDKVKSKN